MERSVPPTTGINAAADWIESEFSTTYSDACGGCLEVKRDAFIDPPVPARRPHHQPQLTNFYGPPPRHRSPPESTRNVKSFTGHYDSRQLRQLQHPRPAAPGANDDASVTSVSLNPPRPLQLNSPTIIFLGRSRRRTRPNAKPSFPKLAKS